MHTAMYHLHRGIW